MSEKIIFQNGHKEWDAFSESLIFEATIGEKLIRCVLPFETICDSYPYESQPSKKQESTERVYADHGDTIRDACRKMIEDGFVSDDGEIVVREL